MQTGKIAVIKVYRSAAATAAVWPAPRPPSPRRGRLLAPLSAPTPRRPPGPTSSSCSWSTSRSEAAAGLRRVPAGSLEPEPRVPASPPGYYVRHPEARTPGGGEGDRSAAPGRRLTAGALVPAWRRGCARPRGFGRALLAPANLGARAKLSSSASCPCLAAESPASRPQCVSGLVPGTAIQTPAAREDRSPSRLPRIPRRGFPRASPSAPACKGTQPCPTGPRGDLSWHLPAGPEPRGPVPSVGTGVRWEGEHARPRQRGAWEEAGLCRSPGSPYPGLEYTHAPCLTCGAAWRCGPRDLNISLKF